MPAASSCRTRSTVRESSGSMRRPRAHYCTLRETEIKSKSKRTQRQRARFCSLIAWSKTRNWSSSVLRKVAEFQNVMADLYLQQAEARGDGDWAVVGDVPNSEWSPLLWYTRLQRFHGRRADPRGPTQTTPPRRPPQKSRRRWIESCRPWSRQSWRRTRTLRRRSSSSSGGRARPTGSSGRGPGEAAPSWQTRRGHRGGPRSGTRRRPSILVSPRRWPGARRAGAP